MTSTHSSIRDSARITSYSTGVCQNVTHESSIYNINYRRRRQQSNATNGTNTNDSVNNNESLNASAAYVIRDAISAAMMPPELPHAPNSPIHGMQNLDNTADDTDTTGTYQRRLNCSQNSSATDEIRDDVMQSDLPPAPTSPTIGMQDLGGTNASGADCQERTCVCHDKVYPKNCSFCQPHNSRACRQHVLIKCSAQNCQKQFHKKCICHLLRIDLSEEAEINSYMCMECTCKRQATNPDVTCPFEDLDQSSKMFRLGLVPDLDRNSNSARDEEKKIKILLRDMETCMPPERLSQFKSTHPLPYPSAVKMNEKAINNHVICGRRFEISMMLYDVRKCHCCGRVQPCHTDTLYDKHSPSPPPFKSQHLVNKHHKAWHCQCWGFCKGSQFFADAKSTHIAEFKHLHGGLHPKQFFNDSQPNAWICNTCYQDHTADQIKAQGMLSRQLQSCPYLLLTLLFTNSFSLYVFIPNIGLEMGLTFSQRNGMGPIPIYPQCQPNEPSQFSDARRLQFLMRDMTLVEEYAIRRIAPMMSIVRLKQGNLASRGNTSCVYQKSRLQSILPNLPHECKYIIVKRKSRSNNSINAGPGLKSTKFRRHVIHEVLVLLKKTRLRAWADIEISLTNLEAWPEQGDILTMDLDINVTEVDDDGNELEEEEEEEGEVGGSSNLPNNTTSVPTLHIGNDAGPAPLQNSVIPEETFEGILSANDRSNVATGQANLLESAV
jgi:hypothetical protein